MSPMWVWLRVGADRVVRRLKEQGGLTIIEYVAFAAVIVLALVGTATFLAPMLKNWMGKTMCDIMGGTWANGASGADGTCTPKP